MKKLPIGQKGYFLVKKKKSSLDFENVFHTKKVFFKELFTERLFVVPRIVLL